MRGKRCPAGHSRARPFSIIPNACRPELRGDAGGRPALLWAPRVFLLAILRRSDQFHALPRSLGEVIRRPVAAIHNHLRAARAERGCPC